MERGQTEEIGERLASSARGGTEEWWVQHRADESHTDRGCCAAPKGILAWVFALPHGGVGCDRVPSLAGRGASADGRGEPVARPCHQAAQGGSRGDIDGRLQRARGQRQGVAGQAATVAGAAFVGRCEETPGGPVYRQRQIHIPDHEPDSRGAAARCGADKIRHKTPEAYSRTMPDDRLIPHSCVGTCEDCGAAARVSGANRFHPHNSRLSQALYFGGSRP